MLRKLDGDDIDTHLCCLDAEAISSYSGVSDMLSRRASRPKANVWFADHSGRLDLAIEIHIPVSVGELFDKISILEIKAERITQSDRLEHIRHELSLLERSRDSLPILQGSELMTLAAELKAINQRIWDAEDVIHGPDQDSLSDTVFMAQAHIAFSQNDLRAQVKRLINYAVGSAIVEEKSYPSFE